MVGDAGRVVVGGGALVARGGGIVVVAGGSVVDVVVAESQKGLYRTFRRTGLPYCRSTRLCDDGCDGCSMMKETVI